MRYLTFYDIEFKPEDSKWLNFRILSTKGLDFDTDYSTRVLNLEFFQCLDDAYMQTLQPAIASFGLQQDVTNIKGSSKVAVNPSNMGALETKELMEIDERPAKDLTLDWNVCFKWYMNYLCQRLENWINTRSENLSHLDDDEERAVLSIYSQIIPKLKAVIKHNLHLHAILLPSVKTPPPFFSKFWYWDLATSIGHSNPGIELVRVFRFVFLQSTHITNFIAAHML